MQELWIFEPSTILNWYHVPSTLLGTPDLFLFFLFFCSYLIRQTMWQQHSICINHTITSYCSHQTSERRKRLISVLVGATCADILGFSHIQQSLEFTPNKVNTEGVTLTFWVETSSWWERTEETSQIGSGCQEGYSKKKKEASNIILRAETSGTPLLSLQQPLGQVASAGMW